MLYIFLIALILFSLALWLLRQGHRAQQASGLPTGEVVYSDTGTWQRVDQPLLSRRYGLVGKPDYILMVAEGRTNLLVSAKALTAVPVEVKSGKRPRTPHLGHILQLGVYCLLVEEQYAHRPSHGLLHYEDVTLRIPFTQELQQEVLAAADAIRRAQSAANVRRNHNKPSHCRACGYRAACGKSALE